MSLGHFNIILPSNVSFPCGLSLPLPLVGSPCQYAVSKAPHSAFSPASSRSPYLWSKYSLQLHVLMHTGSMQAALFSSMNLWHFSIYRNVEDTRKAEVRPMVTTWRPYMSHISRATCQGGGKARLQHFNGVWRHQLGILFIRANAKLSLLPCGQTETFDFKINIFYGYNKPAYVLVLGPDFIETNYTKLMKLLIYFVRTR
jgi:hypothetical protein